MNLYGTPKMAQVYDPQYGTSLIIEVICLGRVTFMEEEEIRPVTEDVMTSALPTGRRGRKKTKLFWDVWACVNGRPTTTETIAEELDRSPETIHGLLNRWHDIFVRKEEEWHLIPSKI